MTASKGWDAVLRDAAARGLTVKQLAKERGVHNSRIYQIEKRYGISLPRRQESRPPTHAEPFVPDGTEQWRVIPGFDGYEASSAGRLRNRSGHVLRSFIRKEGYHRLQITNDAGARASRDVHELIALTFIPNPRGLAQVNHIDHDKLNNAVENLEWLSREDNFRHGREGGRDLAKNNPRVRRKLSPVDVAAIRAAKPAQPHRHANHGLSRRLAAQYGVDPNYIGKLWRGIKREHG